jgi:hypothetical protein
METKKTNRLPKVHLTCEKNGFNIAFNYVMITQENIVATNGRVLIELKTKYYFTKEFIDSIPEVMYIHSKNFVELTQTCKGHRYNSEVELIEIYYNGYEKYIPVIVEPEFKFPNYKSIIPTKQEEVKEIGVDLESLGLIKNSMFLSTEIKQVKLKMHGINNAIIMHPTMERYKENRALLMPVIC